MIYCYSYVFVFAASPRLGRASLLTLRFQVLVVGAKIQKLEFSEWNFLTFVTLLRLLFSAFLSWLRRLFTVICVFCHIVRSQLTKVPRNPRFCSCRCILFRFCPGKVRHFSCIELFLLACTITSGELKYGRPVKNLLVENSLFDNRV